MVVTLTYSGRAFIILTSTNSLSVRLFANMLAGHILLHILAAACVYLLSKFVLLAIPGFSIIGAIGILELGIGFLQAYIFVILLSIYLKDSLYAH